MTPDYFENGQKMMQHVGMGKGCIIYYDQARALTWLCGPLKLLPQLKPVEDVVGHLTHKPGLNTVRTAVQIRDSAQYSEKPYYASLPKVLISPACENSLGWNWLRQRNAVMVKRSPSEGLDCETHPHPECCRNHCHSFGVHFQDKWKSLLAEKQVAFSPLQFRKSFGPYLIIL